MIETGSTDTDSHTYSHYIASAIIAATERDQPEMVFVRPWKSRQETRLNNGSSGDGGVAMMPKSTTTTIAALDERTSVNIDQLKTRQL